MERAVFQQQLVAELNPQTAGSGGVTALAMVIEWSRVYVGTSSGILLEFKLPSTSKTSLGSAAGSVQRWNQRKQIGKRIDKLIVLSTLGRLVALVDSNLVLLDKDTFEGKPLSVMKGISLVYEDAFHPDNPRLLLCSKKRLQVIQLVSNNEFAVLSDLSLPEVLITAALCGNTTFIGTRTRYLAITLDDGNFQDICPLQVDAYIPMIQPLRHEKAVILLVDRAGIVVTSDAKLKGQPFQFSGIPQSWTECWPYLVICIGQQIQVYDRMNQNDTSLQNATSLQRIDIGQAHNPPGHPVASVVLTHDASTTPGQDAAVIATGNRVIMLKRGGFEDQIIELLRTGKITYAIQLVEKFVETTKYSNESSSQYQKILEHAYGEGGLLSLEKLQIQEAFDFFMNSSEFDPIQLFPYFPREASSFLKLVPIKKYWSLHQNPFPLVDRIYESTNSEEMKEALVKQSYETLIDFLEDRRRKAHEDSMPFDSPAYESAINTFLAVMYMSAGEKSHFVEFVSVNTKYDLNVLSSTLEATGRYSGLAILFEAKGNAAQALSMWKKLALGEISEGSGKSNSNSPKAASVEARAAMTRITAVQEASRILRGISDEEVALSTIDWIVEASPETVLEVLTGETRCGMIFSVMPDRVLALFNSKKLNITWRYLQFLVRSSKASERPDLHTELGLSLIDTTARILASSRSGRESSKLSEIRSSLGELLRGSDLYSASELLKQLTEKLPKDLLQERALLYRRLNQHRKALQLLVYDLQNDSEAEKYCHEVGRQDVWLALLDVYLRPGDGREPNFDAAVRLLQAQAANLNPLEVLNALSEDMPLQIALPHIEKMLIERLQRSLQGQIHRNLVKANHLQTVVEEIRQLSRSVEIDETKTCPVCYTRIGIRPFGIFPNGQICCYSCIRKNQSNRIFLS